MLFPEQKLFKGTYSNIMSARKEGDRFSVENYKPIELCQNTIQYKFLNKLITYLGGKLNLTALNNVTG